MENKEYRKEKVEITRTDLHYREDEECEEEYEEVKEKGKSEYEKRGDSKKGRGKDETQIEGEEYLEDRLMKIGYSLLIAGLSTWIIVDERQPDKGTAWGLLGNSAGIWMTNPSMGRKKKSYKDEV
jgi:hypothetical protein